jgi:putative aminopeptidase FrvX
MERQRLAAMKTDQNAAAALAVLADLAARPAAPLHEAAVAGYVADFVRNLGLPLDVDGFGNLLVTYHREPSAQPLALVAHLDHPAIEITVVESPTAARATLLGGVAARYFAQPVPVLLYDGSERATRPVAGTITSAEADPVTGRATALQVATTGPVAPGDFGVFDLPPFQQVGDRLRLRAADDLAGVAAALLALREIVAAAVSGTVYALFTRAEEIGLVGAALAAADRLLPGDALVVSLECSPRLPGAEPGEGPVIRVGDRTSAFHPDGDTLLRAARATIPDVLVQRQLMSGGTCEASAFGIAGYRTGGVALPLVNYHNQGRGDRLAPEEIRVPDFLAEVALLVAAATVAASPNPDAVDARLRQTVARYQERLRASAAPFRTLASPGRSESD